MESGALEDAYLALTGRGIAGADHQVSPAEPVIARDREHRAFRGWRAAIRRRGPSGPPPPWAAFWRIVTNEWRLTLRSPTGLVWGVGFPVLLLVIFGSLPATTKPNAAFGGLSFFEVYLPVMIALSLALLALIGLPVPITSYRELGVLRRMATTPVPPSWLLGGQLAVNLVLLLVAVLVVVAGGVGLGARLQLQSTCRCQWGRGLLGPQQCRCHEHVDRLITQSTDQRLGLSQAHVGQSRTGGRRIEQMQDIGRRLAMPDKQPHRFPFPSDSPLPRRLSSPGHR